ncbi:Haloacid dehalogenase domain protein hydrolase [[Leptolyngbya] sp. PCC 7376]|uniref:HAD family hydrolase n=1 Tax=[Leptolyngbya] sp. PCC 7376 TaxID=111781 RepID=UPI00029EE543|nr:HAD hydrolase-like protein [[Leptolyngbya] sp. PCC 7376]AFY38414.1 Haloacid dehalogenase domain protein hydrolase [[Leptolyngbya] sp. PCC 7376]
MAFTNFLKKAAAPLRMAQRTNGKRLNLTLFCDFDGPLVDVSTRYYSTYQTALQHTKRSYEEQGQPLPIRLLTKAQFWRMKRQRVSDIEIAMKSGLQEEQITFFLDYVGKIVNGANLLHLDAMQSGINWSLGLLHSHGVKLVLVTLREEQQVHRMLDCYGLKRLFNGIYGSGDRHTAYENNIDVKTALLKEAITEQGQLSDDWLMVGDTEADIVAAQRVKIPAIALTCGIRDENYLKTYSPDHICTDLLATAHYLIDRYDNTPKNFPLNLNYCLSNALT